jgi:hypothetical protein
MTLQHCIVRFKICEHSYRKKTKTQKMHLFKGAAYLSLSLLLITSVSSMPNTTQYRLNSMLFDGYDQYIIPVIDTSAILKVSALYSLSQVISIVSFYLYLKHRYLTAIFGHVQENALCISVIFQNCVFVTF